MKQSAVAAYIRQLCSLGLGGKAIMPELFRALHDAIPSHLNVFMYADRHGEYADVYSEYPKFLELNVQFLSEFVDGADGVPSFAECLRTRFGVEANETVFPGEGFLRSDYYNLIYRPQGAHLPLQAAVRDRSGRALGAILVYRAPGDPRYSPEEMRLMASFLPHIAHGMQSRPELSVATSESEDRGLLIVQPPADVLYASPQARSLAHFALNRAPDVEGERGLDAALLPVLSRLCVNLRDAFTGRAAPPPTTSLQSPWGLFTLRAYWLESLQPQENGLVGITIERREPMSLRLLRSMRVSGLTGRQRELCLLLFDGLSIPAAAKRLRISKHTVVDHLKKIYLKLDVHNRDELRSKLEGG
ncbi:MAG TPA: helix-turn-helix transcriptional regulator [Acetobacteraceae bacterium]|nr:helix-turn-helix transcriptional regulator [Acetobacteraceae bacterium]